MAMTQEDLLCDPCRDGCSLLMIAGTVAFHARLSRPALRVTRLPG